MTEFTPFGRSAAVCALTPWDVHLLTRCSLADRADELDRYADASSSPPDVIEALHNMARILREAEALIQSSMNRRIDT